MSASQASTGPGAMRVLVLSAYDAASHRYWRQGLDDFCADDTFTHLALPPRYFSWRIRGNSLSWGLGEKQVLAADYDLVLATSQVDLSSLRGFVPRLGQIPTLVYFHENQFAYPAGPCQKPSLEPQIVNLYSALCADGLLFNSCWNRDSFIDGVDQLLARLPDHVPAGLSGMLASRARVLPVPLEMAATHTRQPAGSELSVVWNHRWEYDKGPAILLAAVEACIAARLPVRFHVLGQQFRQQPPEFEQLAALFAAHPGVAGRLGPIGDRGQYLQQLEVADVVLSTALHEFQGMAVMEAVSRGCIPLVPDRLSYPEIVPVEFRYPSNPLAPELEGGAIAVQLERLCEQAVGHRWPALPDLEAYSWRRLGPRYREIMARCAAGGLRSDQQ